MKNSEEILERINKIPDLEREVARIMAMGDFTSMFNGNINDSRLIELIGDVKGLTEEQIVDKLTDVYMEGAPYIGYCHTYWQVKKSVLKEKYNIDWYTPQEEEPGALFD